jgi:threonine dehydratase
MRGVVAATRGNFGQGVGAAARLLGLKAVIVAPRGNSKEQNRAILAQGVELLEHGTDFQESLEFAASLARERKLEMVESFHELLVAGTACYALEFFSETPPLDVVYVPIGLGSSICGVAAVRNALKLSTIIVGVVARDAPAYALSFREHRSISVPADTQLADGLACRTPNAIALDVIWQEVDRVIEVSEDEIAEAMRAFYEDTHNTAEGAGAAALAGALKERDQLRTKRVGIVLTGGNVDRETFAKVLCQDEAVERD